jgi:hypothetical protein
MIALNLASYARQSLGPCHRRITSAKLLDESAIYLQVNRSLYCFIPNCEKPVYFLIAKICLPSM